MKKFIIFLLFSIAFLSKINAQKTYYWIGGSGTITAPGNWTTANNWSETKGATAGTLPRTTPATNDILIFDGGNIGSGATGTVYVGTLPTQTIGKLTFQTGADVVFATTARASTSSVALAAATTAGTFTSTAAGGTYASQPTGANVGDLVYNAFTGGAPVNVGQMLTTTKTSYTYGSQSAQGVFKGNILSISSASGFTVNSGCTLTLGAGNAFAIKLLNGASGTISGTINVPCAGQRIITQDATYAAASGALTFANGGVLNITSTIYGSVFDSYANSTNDNVVFESGSSYNLVAPVQATATASISAGVVTINFTNRGRGYVTLPIITVTGGTTSGTAATFTAQVGGVSGNASITGGIVTSSAATSGTGYSVAPTITISAPTPQQTIGAGLPFPFNGNNSLSCVKFNSGSTFGMNGIGTNTSLILTTNAATAAGSSTVNFANNTISGSSVYVGQPVSGTNIPANTTVSSLTSNSLTLSNPIATGGVASGALITLGNSYLIPTFGARTFPNFSLTGSTFPASGNLTINGSLGVDATSTLTMGAANILDGSISSTTGSGSINIAVPTATSATPIPSGITWSQLVNYNSTSPQTVVNGTYNGGLNLTGGARTLSSAINISGVYTAGAGTITNTGSTVSFSGTSSIASTPSSFNNLTITGGTLSTAASSTVNVGGNLSITGGTLSTGTSSTLNVTGNWSNSGTFTAGSTSNVVFNGTSQSITGSNSFVNFTKSVTSAATLTLPAGATQTFSGNLTLNGASGNLLTINSSSNGVAALLNYNTGATNTLNYNSIQDITNSNVTALNSQFSTNNSGNTNITFLNLPKVWLGTSSTNWNDANNWSPVGVPIATDNIEVTKTGSFDIVLETAPTVASIIISAGNSLSMNGNNLTVSAAFSNSGTVNVGSGTLAVTGTFTNAGTFNANSGTLNLASTFSNSGTFGANTSTINVTGSFTNSGTFNANSGALDLSSSFIDNGTFNAGTSTVSFNGAGTVTISTGSSTTAFNNVSIASAKTLTGSLNVGGTLTLGNTSTSIVSGTITFNGTALQTIPQSTVYNNLTVNNTTGVNLGNSITVLGNLNLQAGTLADRGFTLTLRGNILGAGTHTSGGFKMANVSFGAGVTSFILPTAPSFVTVNMPIYAAGFDRSTRVTAYDPATRTISFTPATLSAGTNVTLFNIPVGQGTLTALGAYTWTSGNTVTLSATPATSTGVVIGNPITAASGIPAGTVITGYDGATTLTLSQTPTASGTFTGQAVGRIVAQNATATSATNLTLGDASGTLTLGNITVGNSTSTSGVTTVTLGNTVDVNGLLTFQVNSTTATTTTANYIDLNEKTLNCHSIISPNVSNGWILLGGSNSSTTSSFNMYSARVANGGALVLRMDATKKYLNSFITSGYVAVNSTSPLTIASDVIVKNFTLGAAGVVVNTGIASTPASITVLNTFSRLFPLNYGQLTAGGSNSIKFSNTAALTLPSTNPFGSGFSLPASTTLGSTTMTLQTPNLNIQAGQTIANSSLATVPLENGTTVAAYDGNLTITLSKAAIATSTNQTQFFGSPFSTANNSISICDIVINGGGAVNLGCNVGFGGSVTLSNNSSLNVGAYTLGLYTDVFSIASGSSLTANSTSSLVCGGTATNLSLPSNITALNNLTINNTNGVTINSNIALAGTLSLLNGNLKNTVSNNITLANATSVNLSGGGFLVAPVFGTTVNLEYRANSQSVATDNAPDPISYTTGKEIPTSASVLNNLTFNAYSLSGITVANAGAGYTNAPTISIGNAWTASTAYTVGTQVTNGGNLYTCLQAGTSATTTGPLDYGNSLADGTVLWDYVGVAPQAYCKLNGSGGVSVVMTMNGSGYTSAPTITISGVSGNNAGVTTTATATAVLTSPTVTLGSNATVNGNLNLINGKLLLSFYNLTTGSGAGVITGANANSYILTDTTGKFIRTNVPLNTATTFPMGIVGSYTPLIITNTAGATSTMSVGARRYFNYSLGDSTQALFLQWSVLGSVQTTSSITYQFNTNDKGPDFDFASATELGTYRTSYTVKSLGTPTSVGGGVYTLSTTGLVIPTSGNNFYVIANNDNILLTQTTWTGEVSTAWTNAANWTNNVPASNLDVVIPVTTVKPVLSSTATVKNLTLQSGALLTVTSPGIVQISRDFTNNGTVTGTGTVSVKGTAAQAVYGTGTVYNLTIENTSGGVAISSGNQKVGGVLTLKSGVLTANGRLTLKSNAIDSVATVAQVGISGNTGSISGNVIVERFIPKGKRAFRDLVPSVNTNTSVFANWQESGATGVYGTFVTGSALTKTFLEAKSGTNIFNTSTGADYSASGSPSMFSYDNTVASNNWSAGITNTKTSLLTGNKPYRILIRGNRNWSLYLIPQADSMVNAATLRSTGTLYTGTQNITGLNSNANGFSLVGNPYAAVIDWSSLTRSNLNATMWILSPKTRSYITVNGNTVVGAEGSNIDKYIQPGQAFFVQTTANGAASLSITESHKVSAANIKSVFDVSENNANNILRIGLYKPVESVTTSMVDEAAVLFGNYSNAVNGDDSYKMENTAENIALLNSGNKLAIEARSVVSANDVLPLGFSKLSNGTNYQLKVNASGYNSNGFDVYVKDAYKKTETLVKAGGESVVDFTIDNAVSASYNDRFTVVFKPSVLPISSIDLEGSQQGSDVVLSINTVGEHNISNYSVEKSTDGVAYSKIATVSAKNTATASYSVTDNKAVSGNNYYRVKVNGLNEASSYSKVVVVKVGGGAAKYALYPNPSNGSQVGVQLSGVSAGKFTVTLRNMLGQEVHRAVVAHAGGNGQLSIKLASKLSSGSYTVSVLGSTATPLYQGKLVVE